MKYILAISFISAALTTTFAQQAVRVFPLSYVTLSASPFKKAQQTDLNYILALDVDRLLAPFLTEAGLKPKAPIYGSWENSGLGGQTGGHYLSALANMYASTTDPEVLARLKYMVDELERCQQQNPQGYVGGVPGSKKLWEAIAAGKIDAGNFSLNGAWVPWYNLHKLFAGLIDAYELGKVAKAKIIVTKLSDWCLQLTSGLSDEQIQLMLRCEQGGMNEALANVAAITGDKKYLDLAKRFSHRFILNPLLKGIDSLTGLHANTQIPKVVGFMRIAELCGDTDWANAANFFWHTVVSNRSVSFGGNSVREHFNPVDNFMDMLESREGPETCNSYNMLKLSKHLFLRNPSAKYMDYYERTMYNHILSSQHPDGGFVYFTPIRPRHYRVYSQPQQDFWCCVGSGIENHGKYGELIYTHDSKAIFINLFIPSTLYWKEKNISIQQITNFPYEEKTSLKIKTPNPCNFVLHIRKPHWVTVKGFAILVNGKPVPYTLEASSYASIERTWKNNDVITIMLPMQTIAEKLHDGTPWVSFLHGPIVLAAITDTTDMPDLLANGKRMSHIANGPLYPLNDAPLIVSDEEKLLNTIKPLKGTPLHYTLSSTVYPAKFQNLILKPFYTIHNARYVMYWPYANKDGLQKRIETVKAAEAEKQLIEKQTIDQVATGEQQPESDHNFNAEKTETGLHDGRRWRHATGWFSYDLRNKNKNAKTLRITYWGADNNRQFTILANGEIVASVNMDGAAGSKFVDIDYTLPLKITDLQPDIITIKFVAKPGSIAGGVYYIRLLQ